MAINATYTFTPAVTGGSISVTGNTESEVKAAVKAQLATRRAANQANVNAIDTADAALDG